MDKAGYVIQLLLTHIYPIKIENAYIIHLNVVKWIPQSVEVGG